MEGSTAAGVTSTRSLVLAVRRAFPGWTGLLRDVGILTQLFVGLALCFGVWTATVNVWNCLRAIRQNPRAVPQYGGQQSVASPA